VAWQTSGKVVLITVLGGIGTLWGGIIGAAIIVLLEDYLATSGFDGIGIITGSIFIVIVLLFRRGVWGTLTDLVGRRGRRRTEEQVGAEDEKVGTVDRDGTAP
jgi:branched-chain amino acid transport system permease protein